MTITASGPPSAPTPREVSPMVEDDMSGAGVQTNEDLLERPPRQGMPAVTLQVRSPGEVPEGAKPARDPSIAASERIVRAGEF